MLNLALFAAKNLNRETLLRRLSQAAAWLACGLIIAGSIVRITDSGLSCPDWPLCYGRIVPLVSSQAAVEVFHRILAAGEGILVVLLAVLNLRWRTGRLRAGLSIAALSLMGAQVILGTLTVWALLHTLAVAAHLATGMALAGCLLVMALVHRVTPRPAPDPAVTVGNQATRRFRRDMALTAGAVYLLVVSGGLVAGSRSPAPAEWLHPAAAALVLGVSIPAFLRGRRAFGPSAAARALLAPAAVMLAGLAIQAAVGMLMVLAGRPPALSALHSAAAVFAWLSALALAVTAHTQPIHLTQAMPPASGSSPWRQAIRDYAALTKPRVVALLLLTTLVALFITPAGMPPFSLVVWTLAGGYLMAGGANAVNMAYDMDIDRVMARTSRRPVAQGRVTARQAYAFGFSLAGLSLAVFVLFVNPLSAALALAGFGYYVVVYTHWMKRRTPHNIVVGGGAGALPALVGWAGARGQLDWGALLLFGIVFLWTPPHFWALALTKKKDYAAARVPMLPVLAGEAETARQVWLYSIALVVLSLAPAPLQMLGGIYLAGTLILGAVFLRRAWQLRRDATEPMASRLYAFSMVYLAALFLLMFVDRVAARI